MFINDLKSKFVNRFADFKKVANVVEILRNIYSLQPDGEGSNEVAYGFGSNKANLQMEMIGRFFSRAGCGVINNQI